MARIPSPWFWEERAEWCVNVEGRRCKLGPHPEGFPLPKKTRGKWNAPAPIMQAFHAMLADLEPTPTGSMRTNQSATDSPLVYVIFDKYLDGCKKHRSAGTYGWYADHIQNFLDSLENAAALTVAQLKPFHIIEWVDSHGGWSNASKRGAIIALQRPFNWAEEMGYVTVSPIKRIKRPQAERRDNPMSSEDFAAILSLVKEGDPFRALLLFAWHTGCRPREARHIEPRHVQLPAECIVIPKEEAKGRRRPRIIMLDATAFEIVARLMQQQTPSKLFLNANGRPWKKNAICCRFERLHIMLGRRKMKELGITVPRVPRFNASAFNDAAELRAAHKAHQQKLRNRRRDVIKLAREHGKDFAAYDRRHGFAQRLLERGANHLAVAELLGHSNGNMVSQVYSRASAYQTLVDIRTSVRNATISLINSSRLSLSTERK
jgi:integrase